MVSQLPEQDPGRASSFSELFPCRWDADSRGCVSSRPCKESVSRHPAHSTRSVPSSSSSRHTPALGSPRREEGEDASRPLLEGAAFEEGPRPRTTCPSCPFLVRMHQLGAMGGQGQASGCPGRGGGHCSPPGETVSPLGPGCAGQLAPFPAVLASGAQGVSLPPHLSSLSLWVTRAAPGCEPGRQAGRDGPAPAQLLLVGSAAPKNVLRRGRQGKPRAEH